MSDINTVMISGVISDPPRINELDGGKVVARINLKTTVEFERQGQMASAEQYTRAVMWNPPPSSRQCFAEGQSVLLQGTLSTNSYVKNDVKVYEKEIKISRIVSLQGQTNDVPQRGRQQDLSAASDNNGWTPF